jgi:hypothetical protein
MASVEFQKTWNLGFAPGDPTWLGWLSTVGYLTAACLCFLMAMCRTSSRPSETRAWWVIFAFTCCLGLNKQLDLQTSMVHFFGDWASQLGFSARRGMLQAGFFCLFLILMISACAFWLCDNAKFSFDHKILLAGLGLVTTYVLIRVADIMHVFGSHFPHSSEGALGEIELVGTLMISFDAGRSLRRTRVI